MRKKFLFGLLSITLLTVLLSACRIIDASAIPQNPKVRMGSNNFIDSTATVKKGQSLDLVDTVASQHVIVNGTWDGALYGQRYQVNRAVQYCGNVQVLLQYSPRHEFTGHCDVLGSPGF